MPGNEIGTFIERDNLGWILDRHAYRTPAQVRNKFTRRAACLSATVPVA